MHKLLTQFVFICLLSISVQAQDTIFYGNELIEVPNFESCTYYEVESKDQAVPTKIIVTGYYKSGKLKSTFTRVKDIKFEKSVAYYENGQIHFEIEFGPKGIKSRTCFWRLGKLKREEKYEDGKLVLAKCYDLMGKEIPFYDFEEEAMFPGGEEALYKFISNTVVYPPNAIAKNIKGRVVIGFIVTAEGKIEQIKIRKSLHPELDAEAIRVIKMMPLWKPGKQDGANCAMSFNLPIVFEI